MRSYFIFAIVLTVAYLIYYAVIIMQDLYGKRRTGKTEEEVFDLGTLEDEESVAVSESETGFRVGVYLRNPGIHFTRDFKTVT